MPATCDGPASDLFAPVQFTGNATYAQLAAHGASAAMADAVRHAPEGSCVCQGMRFDVPERVIIAKDQPVSVSLPPTKAQWLLFIHTADLLPSADTGQADPFAARRQAMRGIHGPLAQYVLVYADGSEARATMLRKRQLSSFTFGWGNACSEALSTRKARSVMSSRLPIGVATTKRGIRNLPRTTNESRDFARFLSAARAKHTFA